MPGPGSRGRQRGRMSRVAVARRPERRTAAASRRHVARAGAVLAASVFLALGCAPLQVVPLEVEPAPGSLHVDGQEVVPVPRTLELRADRDHKLYFKRDGYRPELIVLRSLEDESGPHLVPARVQARLRPLAGGGRDLTIETEGTSEP